MNNNKIKPVFKFDQTNSIPFEQAHCLLTISVGQEVHEGEKFIATVQLVREHFTACTMLIDDTLQRHTMALNNPEHTAEDFLASSRFEGERWLERNRTYYENLPNLKILRWDQWLMHPQYHSTSNHIQKLFVQDLAVQEAFNQTIRIFLQRYTQRLSPESRAQFDLTRAYQLCFDYLIEECTAMCLWPELECHYEVYPSPRNVAMAYIHQHCVLPKHPKLLHAVAIKFKQRKQFKPQVFSCHAAVVPRLDRGIHAGIQNIGQETLTSRNKPGDLL